MYRDIYRGYILDKWLANRSRTIAAAISAPFNLAPAAATGGAGNVPGNVSVVYFSVTFAAAVAAANVSGHKDNNEVIQHHSYIPTSVWSISNPMYLMRSILTLLFT